MKTIYYFSLMFLCACLVGCSGNNQNSKSDTCSLPPESFSNSDLIGTWTTGNSDVNDTLIFKEDGTYKQSIHINNPSFDYESNWLPWTVETSKAGTPYLHLQEMRLCVYWEGADCQQVGGGTDEWYDFCTKSWIRMPNEGILLVIGPPKGMKLSPPGFSIVALQRSTEGSTDYEKKKP